MVIQHPVGPLSFLLTFKEQHPYCKLSRTRDALWMGRICFGSGSMFSDNIIFHIFYNFHSGNTRTFYLLSVSLALPGYLSVPKMMNSQSLGNFQRRTHVLQGEGWAVPIEVSQESLKEDNRHR